MQTYFTKKEARDAASRQVTRLRKSASVILDESIAKTNDYDQFDVFLSHSMRDAELVTGIKTILEERGLKVYVDWINDKAMDRTKVTPETAAILRKRMKQSATLLYVATESAGGSKWMPWELGYFDGLKNGKVAVVPLMDSPTELFQGQEYLGLYPVVDKDTYKHTGASDVFVEDAQTRRWINLSDFVAGNRAWSPYI